MRSRTTDSANSRIGGPEKARAVAIAVIAILVGALSIPAWVGFIAICVRIAQAWGWL